MKNLKNEKYKDEDNDGNYWIRFTIKTTDGAQYQSEDYIDNLEPHGVSTEYGYIDYTEGKTLNPSTFKYEIYLD